MLVLGRGFDHQHALLDGAFAKHKLFSGAVRFSMDWCGRALVGPIMIDDGGLVV